MGGYVHEKGKFSATINRKTLQEGVDDCSEMLSSRYGIAIEL